MMAFARILAAGAALAGAFVAGPAAALTLTFQIHVTSVSGNASPIDDFQMTWTFEPTAFSGTTGPVLVGDVTGLIETPATADLLDVGGFAEPLPSDYESYGLMQTTAGSNTAVRLVQRIFQGDEITERFSEYQNRIEFNDILPAVANTPGGMVYVLQTFGDLYWRQQAIQWVGGYHFGGPPREYVDGGEYTGTARLIAWDVPPENLAVPEPGAWGLMILGFGLAGGALRRRGIQAAG